MFFRAFIEQNQLVFVTHSFGSQKCRLRPAEGLLCGGPDASDHKNYGQNDVEKDVSPTVLVQQVALVCHRIKVIHKRVVRFRLRQRENRIIFNSPIQMCRLFTFALETVKVHRSRIFRLILTTLVIVCLVELGDKAAFFCATGRFDLVEFFFLGVWVVLKLDRFISNIRYFNLFYTVISQLFRHHCVLSVP